MQRPTTEGQAKDLFVRQLNDLRRRGAAPDSEARLAAIFAKSEAACREQEARLEFGLGDEIRFVPTTPYPFLIVVDRPQRLVLRVIHARKDYRDMVISDYCPA